MDSGKPITTIPKFLNWPGAILFLLAVWMFLGPASSIRAQNQKLDERDEISKLIVQLASDRASVRYQAMTALGEMGGPALARLVKAIPDGDLDFKLRAIKVIQQLGKGEDSKTSMQAEEALVALSNSESQRVANMASKFAAELFEAKQGRAKKRLIDSGAKFTSEVVRIGNKYHNNLQTLLIGKDWKGDSELLAQLRYLNDVKSIEFSGQSFDDSVVKWLPVNSQLISVAFKDTRITNRGLSSLKNQKNLERLLVYYADEVNRDCVDALKTFPKLQEAKFYGTGIQLAESEALQKKLGIPLFEVRLGGFLGIRYQQNSPTCTVTEVVANSGAAKAGIQIGDTIVEYGGEKIDLPASLSTVISKHKVGQAVPVKVNRNGKVVELKVKLTTWQ